MGRRVGMYRDKAVPVLSMEFLYLLTNRFACGIIVGGSDWADDKLLQSSGICPGCRGGDNRHRFS